MTISTREVVRHVEVKESVSLFVCDMCGAEAPNFSQSSVLPVVPSGWLTVEVASDLTDERWPARRSESHLCSYSCLRKFAACAEQQVPA